MQGEAFETWWKTVNEIDAKLGINYHMVMLRSVFGGNGADYMIILIDKSRFDYYNNWEDRGKLRQSNEAFGSALSEIDNTKWSLIKESNWRRMPGMTH